MKKAEDQKIIDAFNKGNKNKALHLLYENYAEAVYRFVYSRSGNKTIAEDITAETFLVLYEVLSNYKGESKLKNFIIGIAFNKLKEFWRESNKKQNWVSVEDFIENKEMDDLDKVIVTEEVRDIEDDNKVLVKEILSKLPGNYVEILTLKFLKSKDNKEISKVMKISLENVRQLQRRALIKASELANKFI